MSKIMKTPNNTSIAELRRVMTRYYKPRNSMEAFILYGATMALAMRDIEHAEIRDVPLEERHEPEDDDAAIEFDSVIGG